MKKFKEYAKDLESLEFPDWSGMDDSSQRITPEAALALSEEYRAWFPQAVERWHSHRVEKCLVEFVLED